MAEFKLFEGKTPSTVNRAFAQRSNEMKNHMWTNPETGEEVPFYTMSMTSGRVYFSMDGQHWYRRFKSAYLRDARWDNVVVL